MRIGIYGGTFDPPHIGHLQAAQSAVDALGLDKLLLIPACIPPNQEKTGQCANAVQRLEMLKRSVPDDERFSVSDLEISRGGVSYTFETLRQLRNIYPDGEFFLLLGTDMFLSLSNWQHGEEICREVSLGVMCRGQRDEESILQKQKVQIERLGVAVHLIGNSPVPISSSDLRRMLFFRCGEQFLPPAVAEYIKDNGLYGVNDSLLALPEKELEKAVISLLKPNRVAHVLGCRDTAVALAKIWGADETHAARAALLHDVTKALDGPLQLTLCEAYGIILDNFSTQNPKTLHALTGSLVAERIFGEAPEVVSAIRSHTTGKANMNMLEKIIYVADYMEPNRDFPGVAELRRLAYTDMDGALQRGLEMTLSMLREQGKEISVESQQALEFLKSKKG